MIKKATVRLTPYYIGLASIGVLMMISAFIFPDRKASVMQAANDKVYVQSFKVPVMTSDELAYRLIDPQDKQLQILDFRTEKEYTKFNLPKSTLFTIDNLFEKEPNKIISIKHKINLIVANDELTERKIAVIADELGYKRIKILQGGLSGFTDTILNFKNSDSTLAVQNPDTYRFRTKAHRLVPVMIMQNKTAGPVKKVQKRVLGGC